MGKPSRSKPSRSARKQDRERRERAVEKGLPVAVVPPPRRVVAQEPEVRRDAPDPVLNQHGVSASSSFVAPSLWERFRRIPPSIQLLGAGIFVLIGIGLFRRYTETIPSVDNEPAVTNEGTQVLSPLGSTVPVLPTASGAVPSVASGVSTPLDAPSAMPSAAPTASAVVTGTRPKSAKTLTSSAPEPKAVEGARSKPVPQANTVNDATPAAAENPY